MARQLKRVLRKAIIVGPNLVFQRVLQDWLEANSDGMDLLTQARIKPGYITAILSSSGLDEKVLFPLVEIFERVMSIDFRLCLLQNAKLNLWGDSDRLPEITTYDQMLARLRQCYAEYSPKNELARELEICESCTIPKWVKERTKIATPVLERVLKLLLRLDHPEVYRELYPVDLEVEGLDEGGVSSQSTRLAINSLFGSVLGYTNLLKSLMRETGYEPVLGDQAKALSAALGVLQLFGIDDQTLEDLDRQDPLSRSDLELLGKAFGKKQNGKGKS